MSYHGKGDEVRFEEQNSDWLLERFVALPDIRDRWADFVYTEYMKSLRELDDVEDR